MERLFSSPNHLREELESVGYFADARLSRQVYAALHTKPVAGAFLAGPAGSGKTYLPEVLADLLDVGERYYFQQCFEGTREDDLLVKLIPSEETVSGIKTVAGQVVLAAEASHTGLTMLVLDEWDKARPSADAFLLDFLQYGRIRHNGVSLQANLDSLIVFITTNDERELSEPLLRRLPRIDFSSPSPSIVERALIRMLGKHQLIPAVLNLYRRCLIANLPKPATIQELRQLIEAADALRQEADWDELVYQFVTKSLEAHQLLKQAEDLPLELCGDQNRPHLDPSAYGSEDEIDEDEWSSTVPEPAMPQLVKLNRKFNKEASDERLDEDSLEGIGALLERNDNSYDLAYELVGRPEKSDFSDTDEAKAFQDKIVLYKPINLLDAAKIYNYIETSIGEVCLVEPLADYECVDEMRKQLNLKVYYASKDEILMRNADKTVFVRISDNGLEAIMPTGYVRSFIHFASQSKSLYYRGDGQDIGSNEPTLDTLIYHCRFNWGKCWQRKFQPRYAVEREVEIAGYKVIVYGEIAHQYCDAAVLVPTDESGYVPHAIVNRSMQVFGAYFDRSWGVRCKYDNRTYRLRHDYSLVKTETKLDIMKELLEQMMDEAELALYEIAEAIREGNDESD